MFLLNGNTNISSVSGGTDLNTSYVSIKQVEPYMPVLESVGFKYILCFY